MKHAGSEALDRLEELLGQLRGLDGLVERTRGVFYRRSRAFLHFHEDAAGLFADIRPGGEWLRLPANSPNERAAILTAARAAVD